MNNNERDRFSSEGFLQVDKLIEPSGIPDLLAAFEELFRGRFETGVRPDELNWQYDNGDPSLTRQICNGWKGNRTIAETILSKDLGEKAAKLMNWPGARIMIDNVLWKPPGGRSLGFHQDSAFLDWLDPEELVTCWIALDDTNATGGTLELVKSSHRWQLLPPVGEFHAPENYLDPMQTAAVNEGVEPDISYIEVPAGGGSFHHGRTWHGSGNNKSEHPRRALVLHAMRSDATYNPSGFSQGIGPIYSRYKRLADNQLDENHFPILWTEKGYRTPEIDQFLANSK